MGTRSRDAQVEGRSGRGQGVKGLRRLNDFLLGEEPDFKTMPMADVKAYLNRHQLDSTSAFRKVRQYLRESYQ